MRAALAGVIGLVVSLDLTPRAAADPSAGCHGAYAEDLSALSPRARELERRAAYSYAVRTTATYECVSYGGDGRLQARRATASAYGTAFAYRRDGGDTLLVTNDHVAEWPAVTDDDHPADGVPSGCKRVAEALTIVDDDHDDYPDDDVPLARVVADPALDVAILRAHAKLAVMPWRIGTSAALVARDAVEIRGYPLGEFQATNTARVISPHDHDAQGDWDHDDFVVDALLASGGSGSPVLAVSCKTGELELVGIFHAHYTASPGLDVVIAIDQARELMTTLKAPARPAAAPAEQPDAAARARLIAALGREADPPFFAVGPLAASVHARSDGALVFALFPPEFPADNRPMLVIEDLAGGDAGGFGATGAIYVRGDRGLHRYTPPDAETRASFDRALAMLRMDAVATFDTREASRVAPASRAAFEQVARARRALAHMIEHQRDAAQAIEDLIGRAAPQASGATAALDEIEGAAPIASAP